MGMRIDLDKVFDLFLELQKEHLVSAYKGLTNRPKKLYVVQKKSEEVNAYAESGDEVDHIVLYSGLLMEIAKNVISICHIDSKKKNGLGVSWSESYFLETVLLMLYMSTFFIVAHEFSHIYYGHCDYLRSNMDLSKIDLFGKEISPVAPLDYQALEMCADAGAICMYVDKVMAELDSAKNLALWGYPMTLSYCLAAFHVVFYTLRKNDGGKIASKIRLESHPPLFLRHLQCISTCGHYMNKNYPDICDDPKFQILYSFYETEELLKQETGFGFSASDIGQNIQQVAYEHEKVLIDHWKNSIGEKLLCHARIRLPRMEQ